MLKEKYSLKCRRKQKYFIFARLRCLFKRPGYLPAAALQAETGERASDTYSATVSNGRKGGGDTASCQPATPHHVISLDFRPGFEALPIPGTIWPRPLCQGTSHPAPVCQSSSSSARLGRSIAGPENTA